MASSPFAIIADAVTTIFDTEFSAEGFTMIRDKLHESLGRDRVDVGIAPAEAGDVVMDRNALVQETWVEVRFYDIWREEITPTTVVDPTRVTDFAERFRNALRNYAATDPGSAQVWYFDVRQTTYPDDPTGNKTRFHMIIRAFGNNAGLVESS